MITFTADNTRFKFRIVGIALHDDRVLLHRLETDDYWSLPGGTGELLEPAADTLRREMLEEMGESVNVDWLVYVVEHFFDYEGMRHHELAFYFLMTLAPDSPAYRLDTFPGVEDGKPLIFQWHPLATLDEVPLYPTFLRRGLQALPAHTTYLVHTDIKP